MTSQNELRGVVSQTYFSSPTFSAGRIRQSGGSEIRFSGKVYLRIGEAIIARGKFICDSKYGEQFAIESVDIDQNLDARGLANWLSVHPAAVGIGPVRAKKIADSFSQKFDIALREQPEEIAAIAGVPVENIHALAKEWASRAGFNAVATQLAAIGLTKHQIESLIEACGSTVAQALRDDPYSVLGRVPGFGFKKVDDIARKNYGVAKENERRIDAGIVYCLKQALENGSTCMSRPDLCGAAEKVLFLDGLDAEKKICERMDLMAMSPYNDIAISFANGVHYYSLTWVAEQERFVADFLVTGRERNPCNLEIDLHSPEIRSYWQHLDSDQLLAVTQALCKRIAVMSGGAGCGKCLGRGTPVMLVNGNIIPVEQVNVGDVLMGPDSQPRIVGSISCGYGPLYRIDPIKGDSWVCNDVHVMTLRGTNRRTGEISDVELRLFLDAHKNWKRADKNWKLFRVPIDFPTHNLPFDPYLIGVWLGDGTSANSDLNLGPKKSAVRDYAKSLAPSMGLEAIARDDKRSAGLQKIRFRVGLRGVGCPSTPHQLHRFLQNECRSECGEKIIPKCYIMNSEENRLQLLAGLIDTDGSLVNCGYDWCSKSKQMAEQMVFLCRSLGFAAYMKPKSVKLAKWKEPRTYYRVSISGDVERIPCKVKSKQSPPRRQIKDHLVTGWTATPIGNGEYFGFTLSGDGRFLLGDFTVTHNTTTIKAIAAIYKKFGKTVALCCPTGKAARRLSQVSGLPAQTIHRLLEYSPILERFMRDADNPIDADVVIVDEVSMVDLPLAYSLSQAIGPQTAVLLVGDHHQLPPVGPGALLRDCIAKELVPIKILSHCHRQAGQLKQNCSAILDGDVVMPVCARSATVGIPAPWYVDARHDGDDPSSILKVLERLWLELIPQWGYDKLLDTQVLSGMHRGAVGTRSVNILLQRLHQASLGVEVATVDAKERPKFYLGDKVICARNNYQLAIMNGMQGLVKSLRPFVVTFEERDVEIPPDKKDTISLAYCLTPHKCQGSEWPLVVLICHREQHIMLHRAWLYTGCTRAMKTMVLIGDRYSIERAARVTKPTNRQTILSLA